MSEDTTTDTVIEQAARVIAQSQNPGTPGAFQTNREDWIADARALYDAGLLGRAATAAELERLADELDVIRAEWLGSDASPLRSSGLGCAIVRLRARADELAPEGPEVSR